MFLSKRVGTSPLENVFLLKSSGAKPPRTNDFDLIEWVKAHSNAPTIGQGFKPAYLRQPDGVGEGEVHRVHGMGVGGDYDASASCLDFFQYCLRRIRACPVALGHGAGVDFKDCVRSEKLLEGIVNRGYTLGDARETWEPAR